MLVHIAIRHCSDDEVRLRLGVNPGEGLVEVCVEENWATICDDDGWDEAAASVVCRQLGFQSEGQLRLTALQ